MDTTAESSTDTAILLSQIANLQAELEALRSRYDTLHEANNRAAARYKADFKKWRDFKRWMFEDSEKDDKIKSFLKGGELDAYKKVSTLGKRKHFEDFGPDLQPAGDEDERIEDNQEEMKPAVAGDFHMSPVSADSRHQRRKSYHGEPSHKVLSPSRNNKDPFLDVDYDEKPSVRESSLELPCKAESSRPNPATEPRKGRGRYGQVPAGIDTINSRFSIRKENNDGLDFQYDAVVRNREERRHMLGGDCECCRDYYEAVGPLPPSRQPLWRSPTKPKRHHGQHFSNNKENADEIEEHKQQISRHRHHWHRPKTPPGYWDIGFPDTQEVLDINRRAADMHKRKLIDVEAEAKSSNSRFAERAPRTP